MRPLKHSKMLQNCCYICLIATCLCPVVLTKEMWNFIESAATAADRTLDALHTTLITTLACDVIQELNVSAVIAATRLMSALAFSQLQFKAGLLTRVLGIVPECCSIPVLYYHYSFAWRLLSFHFMCSEDVSLLCDAGQLKCSCNR